MAGTQEKAVFTVGDTYTVYVCRTDITKLKVDVVVNPTDKQLKHESGISKALVQAAGPELARACEKIMKEKGQVEIGDVIYTTSGHLPCKAVLHTVGPQWPGGGNAQKQDECRRQLKRTFENVLNIADISSYSSIALPPISTGKYGVSASDVAMAIVEAIQFSALKNKKPKLREIHVVDIKDDVLECVIDLLNQGGYKDPATGHIVSVERVSEDAVARTGGPAAPISNNNVRSCSYVTRGDLQAGYIIGDTYRVFIYRADITTLEVDAIVNGTDENLRHGSGVAKAIADAAGPDLHRECEHILLKKGKLKIAEVVQTTSGGMPCKDVLHTVGPMWPFIKSRQKLDECRHQLSRTFRNVMDAANIKEYSSIAVPPLGAGKQGVPGDDVAAAIVEALTFNAHGNIMPNLREIHLVDIKDDVLPLVIAMLDQCSNADEPNEQTVSVKRICDKKEQDPDCPKPSISVISAGFYARFIVGNVNNVYIYRADITKLKVDAIVSETDMNLEHDSGLAKAIVQAAGSELDRECKEIIKAKGCVKTSEVVHTTAGELPCKHVIHTVGPHWLSTKDRQNLNECHEQLKRVFENVLTFAGAMHYGTIAIPPISSGTYGVPSGEVAGAIVEAIKSSALKHKSTRMTDIHVVDDKNDILALVISLLNLGGYKVAESGQFVTVERTTVTKAQTIVRDAEQVKRNFFKKLFTGGCFGNKND